MALFHSFLNAEQYSIVYIYLFFIHSSVDGYLDCFHVLVIVKSAAMHIGCVLLFKLHFSPDNMLKNHMETLFLDF